MAELAAAVPTTNTTSALVQLLVAFALISAVLAGLYIWAGVLTARLERRRVAFPPPEPRRRPVVREPLPTTSWEAPEPVGIQPRGAQFGKHRAELLEHITQPIELGSVERARSAR